MMNKLEVEYIPPSELKPYEGNPRIHSDKQIQKLISSIQEYGIVLPVLIDAGNVIIAGHAVVKACIKQEIAEIPCIRATHLSEAQKRAYILADNRLAEDSSWDKGMLKAEMLKLRDEYGLVLEGTGFETREILRLRMDVAEPPKDEDAAPEAVSNPVSRLGDIWILGEHRLICGSCTESESHWQGSRSESTLWEIDYRDQDAQTNHGTQKPVECMRRPMLNNSAPNEIIYEPFSGSGTTIIAAESCRRRCYAVELNPEYVDMAVKRFEKYTGRQAVLDGNGHTFAEVSELRSEAGD